MSLKRIRDTAQRPFFILIGMVSLVLGIIGIFLPLLPTTVFVLISAFCFARGSKTLHRWLMQHRVFGPLISNWETHGSIPRRAKWLATISILVLVPYPLYVMVSQWWLALIIAFVLAAVLLFIWSRPDTVSTSLPKQS